MARFDVYDFAEGVLMLDCQSNLLSHYNTRFTVPLMRPQLAPRQAHRLNPGFEIKGFDYVMVTQFAAAIPVLDLGKVVVSLAEHDYRITNALDTLTTGF